MDSNKFTQKSMEVIRVHQKKAVGEKDQRLLRVAEDLLFGELAIPLGIPKDQVGTYINGQVR